MSEKASSPCGLGIRCPVAPGGVGDGSARLAAGAVAPSPDWPGLLRGVRAPGTLYAAVCTDDAGTAVGVAGPFPDRDAAAAHVAAEFRGHGHPAPFRLVFRLPRPP